MRRNRIVRLISASIALPLLALTIYPSISQAANPTVVLGSTSSFAVLASSTITNTGATTIGGSAGGNVGLWSGTSYTGSGTVVQSNGVNHITDSAANTAQTDLSAAITSANSPAATSLAAADLAGKTIFPGVYTTPSGAFINSGALILDAQNDPTAVFIFRTSSTLTTSPNSTMSIINQGQACHVFWTVASSATLDTNSTFIGHIFATVSITALTGAKITGSLLASTGAVTLQNNTITNDSCAAVTPTPTPTTTTTPGANGTLTVVKHVINDGGGTKVASDFTIHVLKNGVDVAGSPVQGADITGRSFSLAPGSYTVAEDPAPGYTGNKVINGVSTQNVEITSNSSQTMTITNNDINHGTLVVVKHVINDGGGTAVASDFPLHVTLNGVDVAGSPALGAESPGHSYSLAPGTYVVSEPSNPYYTSSYSGIGILGDTVTVTSDTTKTITITNNDVNLATLHVVKNVVNRYTGTSVPGDFIMHVKLNGVDVAGSPAVGVGGAGRTYRLIPGNYAVSEDEAVGYFGNFDGPELSNGYVTLASDADVTVSRTNYDKFVATPPTPTPTPTPVVTPTPTPTPTGTVTGGKLPKTGTPWNNLLALGAGLILIGAVGFTSRKVLK